MNRMTCLLPGGYVDESGALHREVELVPLGGREEEFLADSRKPASAAMVTAVVSRCIRRIGTISPVSEETARKLLVADRQYLLLRLREATFGDQVQATVPCPWPDCGKRADIDFSMNDIPVSESKDKGPTYTMELSPEAMSIGDREEECREIIFRLPNGGDQEVISPLISKNGASALSMLLGRCIQRIGSLSIDSEQELISRLSPLARLEIEREMERAAPKVDLTIDVDCPECGRAFLVPFDFQDFFFGELRINRDLLYREVHYLAYHYHWSEQEILRMPRDKRRNYIEVLADEIERLNNAV